jgi:hypothetical protein
MSNGTADTEIFEDELEAPSAMLAACKPVQSARWADMSGDEPEDDFDTKVTDIETKEDLVTVLTQTRAIPATERARRLCIIGGLSEEATKEVVSELFSPPRVTAALKSKDHGWLRAGSSFDLVVDAVSGQSWDFLQAEDRRRCWRQLQREDPWVVIGSPPCTVFSALQALNKGRTPIKEQQRKLIEGTILLNFATDVYRWQVKRGRYFLHEHPATATSWKLPEVHHLLSHPKVDCIVSDMCMFGMKTKDEQGCDGPVRKPTRWMTNVPCLAKQLNRRCQRIHGSHV